MHEELHTHVRPIDAVGQQVRKHVEDHPSNVAVRESSGQRIGLDEEKGPLHLVREPQSQVRIDVRVEIDRGCDVALEGRRQTEDVNHRMRWRVRFINWSIDIGSLVPPASCSSRRSNSAT